MSDPTPWVAAEAGPAPRKHAPATLRNRMVIADALRGVLPVAGTILEIASGSGEHAAYFAGEFPALDWQPSDPDGLARISIAAWCADMPNVLAPLDLDAAAGAWPVAQADAILCINMVHISPWAATLGLMVGAARVLGPGAPLVLYGPFVRDDAPTAPSNLAFDQSLRARDPAWGLRSVEAVVATGAGFDFERQIEMPANNLLLVLRRR